MSWQRLPRPLAALLLVAAACGIARADEFVDRANAVYATIRSDRRSDVVLLPAMAKMEAPPASCATIPKAMLLPAGTSGWTAAQQWATGATQKAVLEALDKVTQNSSEGFAFGQPYGSDGPAQSSEGVTLIRANLYTDLGDPPLLAVRFLFLPVLDRVGCLVNVDATRLAADGKPKEAMHLLIDWLFFVRQMADRASFQECRWGLRTMIATFDRVRDIAYVDFREGKKQLTQQDISEVLDRLRSESDGYLRLDRLTFPVYPKIASEQVVANVFTPQGTPNAEFGHTMARLASTARPLRLFAEAARWDTIAKSHGDAMDTAKQLQTVYNDLAARWPLDPFDARLSLVTDYEKMNKARFALLSGIVPEMTVLFNDRQVLRTQAIGKRCAPGIMAFYYGSKSWPPQLESIRPRFLKVIEADPFNSDRARGKQPPLEYFVPIRDQKFADRQEPKPHEMNVVVGDTNFQVKIGSDQFVLYSLGPNGAKDWAKEVSGEPPKGAIGDLLIWPPITSLLRQRQVETGLLK